MYCNALQCRLQSFHCNLLTFLIFLFYSENCIVLCYLSKFFFSRRRFYDIVQTCCIWLIFRFYHDLFLFFMFLYLYKLYLILRLYILFSWDSCIGPTKKGLIVETSLDLLYLAILFLLSSCYWLLLSNQNQSFYLFQFHNPTKFMTKKKIFLSGDLCIMSCSQIFLSQDGIFQNSMGCNKKNFLLPTMVVTFGKQHSLISPISRKRHQFSFSG